MSQVAQIAFRKLAVRTAVPSTDKSSSLHPKKGGRFFRKQGAFFSVMLIAYREIPSAKGILPLLERVFVVLRITLTRSKNAPNHGLMVKCTPERGHNALFFIPLEVIIML